MPKMSREASTSIGSNTGVFPGMPPLGFAFSAELVKRMSISCFSTVIETVRLDEAPLLSDALNVTLNAPSCEKLGVHSKEPDTVTVPTTGFEGAKVALLEVMAGHPTDFDSLSSYPNSKIPKIKNYRNAWKEEYK